MNYTQLELGMFGDTYTTILNSNFSATSVKLGLIDDAIAIRVISDTIQALKLESGVLKYTENGTDWVSVSSVAWGNITGNLSSQVDLVNALGNKASVEQLGTLSGTVSSLGSTVEGLATTVSSNTNTLGSNTTAIGLLQTAVANVVKSATLKAFRLGVGDYLEYSLNNTTWVPVKSISELSWGGIVGTLSNQTDLQQALATKASNVDLSTHANDKTNVHEVTKEQVGLANVDNTADVDKPISTAVGAAMGLLQEAVDALDSEVVKNDGAFNLVQMITLIDYNTMKSGGLLSPTTLYVIEE